MQFSGQSTPYTSRYAMWGRTKPADRPEWKALQSTHLTITRQGLMTSFEVLADPSEHLPRGTRQYRTRPSLSPPTVPRLAQQSRRETPACPIPTIGPGGCTKLLGKPQPGPCVAPFKGSQKTRRGITARIAVLTTPRPMINRGALPRFRSSLLCLAA